MKQPSYVETVTSMYRKYTDLWAELEGDKERFRVSREDQRALLGAYTRRGYTDGLLHPPQRQGDALPGTP